MNQDHYDERRRRIKKEAAAARQLIDDSERKQLKALEFLSFTYSDGDSPRTDRDVRKPHRLRRGELESAFDSAFDFLGKEFDLNDVLNCIKRIDNALASRIRKAVLSNFLAKKAANKDGSIRLKERGKGRATNIYEKINANSAYK